MDKKNIGNKRTKGKQSWEQRNKSFVSDILGNGNTKIGKILLGNKERQGNFCWEQGNMDRPGMPSIISSL